MSFLDRFKSASDKSSIPESTRSGHSTVKLAALGGAGLLALAAAYSGTTVIDQSDRGLVYTFGKLSSLTKDEIRQPGLNFSIPFVQEISKKKVVLQEILLPQESIYTKDSQEIKGNVSIQFRTPEDSLIHIALNNPLYQNILISNVRQALKDTFGKTEATSIASNRDEVMIRASKNVKDTVENALGVEVSRIQLPDFEFEANFKASIVSAMSMKAEAEKAKLAVAKAESEADSSIQAARGRAESTKLQAEADFVKAQKAADGELYKLNKQAEGQQRLAAAIGQNNLASYWFNQTWNGALPTVNGGQAVVTTDIAAMAAAAAASNKKADTSPVPTR